MTRWRRFILIFCSTALVVGTPQVSLASRSRGMRAAADIRAISNALEMYEIDTGNYPTQSQGLAALSTKPEGMDSSLWGGPYLEKLPKDPWGNDYVYIFPGKKSREGFDLYSVGRDGESATGGNDRDDVNNWDPESGSYYPDPFRTMVRRVTLLVFLVVCALYAGARTLIKRARTKESS